MPVEGVTFVSLYAVWKIAFFQAAHFQLVKLARERRDY